MKIKVKNLKFTFYSLEFISGLASLLLGDNETISPNSFEVLLPSGKVGV